MAKALVLFILGGAAGAAAAYGVTQLGAGGKPAPAAPGEGAATADTRFTSPPASASLPDATTAAAANFASARLAAYEAAAAADAFDLETLINEAASAPLSRRRDMTLDALLARLAELEPRRAVEVAQVLRLETRFLVPVFEAWAAVDADAAIAELESVIEPAALRTLALAVLRTLGNDARNTARVASALPESDRLVFSIDGIADRAQRDLASALAAAAALDIESAQLLAVRRVAEAAAQLDSHAALAAANVLTDPNHRSVYRNAVLNRWARADPSAVLAYLEAAPASEIPSSAAVLTAIASSDPERLLAMLDRLPTAMRSIAQRSALQALAARNPLDAIAQLAAMPPGQDRTSALQSIAQAYGRQNPDAALAWAKAQTPPSREALSGVMRGIAEVDFDRALDLIISELETSAPTDLLAATLPSSLLVPLVMSSSVGGSERDFARIADRLASVENPRVRSMMSTMLSAWSQTDPDGAVAWVIANAERLEPSALSSAASQMGQSNAALARTMVDRLPPRHRAAWVMGAASSIAQSDPDAALRFIEPYRGQPEYDQAFGNVVTRIAQNDPVAAARLLATAPPSAQANSAATMIARNWAARDPVAAAQFVMTLPDARVQGTAARSVADAWARTDADAAQRWVLSLPSGALRDDALNGYLNSAATAGVLDTRVLSAFSNDRTRDTAVSSAIGQIGRTNLPEARRLLEQHVTDPELRRRTEELLARTGGSGSSSSGAFIDLGGILIR